MKGSLVRADDERDAPLLASLVGDVAEFEAEFWGRRPLLRSTGCRFDDLLSLADVDRIVASGVRRPAFRLVRDGATLAAAASARSVRLGGRQLDDVADPDRVAAELAAGATLVLQGLQRTWPPLDAWCRRLDGELAHPVQANAYLTPPGGSGLAEHVDEHDVLVLHVGGAKQWTIDGIGDCTLAPGDVVYLPAGTRHAASAAQRHSLHLTVGILRTTVRAALERALRRVHHPDLDRPLPLGYDHAGRRGALEVALAAAIECAGSAMDGFDVGAVAAAEVDRRAARRRRSGAGRLRSVLAIGELDDDTVVVARSDRSIRCLDERLETGRVVLELSDRRISLPGAMAPALGLLLVGASVRVGALPGLDEGDRQVLVRRLVVEGVVDVVDVVDLPPTARLDG